MTYKPPATETDVMVGKSSTITETDKFHCIERELVFRRRTYARLVDNAKMMPGKAARELALMEAILEDYRARAESDRLL